MTVYIVEPGGKLLPFNSDEEATAYRATRRAAQRAAEPAWLQRLRKYHSEVAKLERRGHDALEQRNGRSAALKEIQLRLSGLFFAMKEDIEAAASHEDTAL